MASLVGIPIAEDLWFRSATVDDTLPVITLWKACHLVRPWNDPAENISFCPSIPCIGAIACVRGG